MKFMKLMTKIQILNQAFKSDLTAIRDAIHKLPKWFKVVLWINALSPIPFSAIKLADLIEGGIFARSLNVTVGKLRDPDIFRDLFSESEISYIKLHGAYIDPAWMLVFILAGIAGGVLFICLSRPKNKSKSNDLHSVTKASA